MMNNRSCPAVAVVVIAVVLLSAALARAQTKPAGGAAGPAKIKITVSKETTYVLGPVNADGTVNYAAALNEILSKDLKPADNAAIPILQTADLEKAEFADMLKSLGAAPAPGRRTLINIYDFCEQAHKSRQDTKAAEEQYYKSIEAPWTAKQLPLIAEYLKAVEAPLGQLVKATGLPKYYVPYMAGASAEGPMLAGMVHIRLNAHLRHCARTLKMRAMQAAGEGEAATAMEYLSALHRLARLTAQQGTLKDWLVAAAMEQLAGDAVLAKDGNLAPAQARKQLVELDRIGPLPGVAGVADVGDRLVDLDTVMTLARHGMPVGSRPGAVRGAVDWDAVLRAANEMHNQLAAALRKENRSERVISVQELFAAARKEVEDANLTDDAAVEESLDGLASLPEAERARVSRLLWYAQTGLFSLELYVKMPEIQARREARWHLNRLAVALAAHRAEKGEYPATLEALAPDILKKIPNDPFPDKAFVYKRTEKGYVLYSVGPNLKDDGGKEPGAGTAPATGPGFVVPLPAEEPDDIVVKVE